MQFRVVVPDSCSDGETLRIHLSDGTEANVTIPSGLAGGDSFVCDVPTEQMNNPDAILRELQQQQTTTKTSKRQQRKQQKNLVAEIDPDDSSIKTTTSATAMVVADERSFNDPTKTAAAVTARTTSTEASNTANSNRAVASSSSRTFLEREIIDCQDFFLALAVGLMVGSAMVVGFLLGIVHSTEAIYSIHPIEKPKTPKTLHSSSSRQQQQQQRQRSFTITRNPHAPKSRTFRSAMPNEEM